MDELENERFCYTDELNILMAMMPFHREKLKYTLTASHTCALTHVPQFFISKLVTIFFSSSFFFLLSSKSMLVGDFV